MNLRKPLPATWAAARWMQHLTAEAEPTPS